MKLWSDTQMFFVVDTEFCQNEADDPKDAIVYFFPQDTTDTKKCTLCCHIMGICRFMKFGFSPVSLVRLSKGKFAIKALGKYLLALRGGLDMPDSILQRQLNSMIDIFLLLYNGFEAVVNESESREAFLEKMNDLWSILLPISQYRGDSLSLTFNIIPSLDLPKTAGLLFLQASQFLQVCQRFSGVYSGCLFCDQKVLCSQMPITILTKLAFLSEKQKCVGKSVPVAFDLPGSVRLLFIYLSPEEVHELSLTRFEQGPSVNIPMQDEGPGPDLEQNGNNRDQSPFHPETAESDDATNAAQEESTHLLANGENESRSSYDSCGNDRLDTLHETLNASYSSSDATLTQDALETSSSFVAESRDTRPTSSDACSGSMRSSCRSNEPDDFQQFVLYLQGYNDTVLALILDANCTNDASTILGLWKHGMNTLMTLETDVKGCLEMSPDKNQDRKADSSYLYLQYDRKLNKAKGDLKVPKGSGLECQIFNRSVQLMHEDFLKESRLYETTVCSRDFVIYGHKMGSRETYYQSGETSPSDHNVGFPLQSDQMCTVSTRAKKRLERDHGLVLL